MPLKMTNRGRHGARRATEHRPYEGIEVQRISESSVHLRANLDDEAKAVATFLTTLFMEFPVQPRHY